MYACLHYHSESAEALPRLLEFAEPLSPQIEVLSSHSVLVKLGKQPFQAAAFAPHHLPISAGVSALRYVAELAAQITPAHYYRLIPSGEEQAFLDLLSVNLLPVEPETHRKLHLLGLRTLKDLRGVTKKELLRQFGEQGALLFQRARGRDSRPFSELPYEEPLTKELEFEQAVQTGQALYHAALELCEALFITMRERAKLCSQLQLLLTLEGETAALTINLAAPVDDPERVKRVLRSRLDSLTLDSAVLSVKVILAGLVAGYAQQLNLFDLTPEEEKRRGIQRVASELAAKHRKISLMHVQWRDPTNRLPERRAHLQDLVYAPVQRPLCLPKPLMVATAAEGAPAVVRVQDGWVAVDTVLETWELEEDWWTSRPIMRTYYRVMLQNGILMRLFHDEKERRWFRQQV